MAAITLMFSTDELMDFFEAERLKTGKLPSKDELREVLEDIIRKNYSDKGRK